MKIKSITKNVVMVLAYILLAGVTVYLYPRYDRSFPYRYEVGRPWSYDRLVAEFDFPIYKSEAQLNEEQEEVLRDFAPIYTYVEGQPQTPLVVSLSEREALVKDNVEHISVVDNKVATLYSLKDVYTPKSAYVAFEKDYTPNLVLDTAMTNQMRASLLSGISLTRGIVQAGEKIVDRGDIVTEETAMLLQSLKIEIGRAHV